MMAPTMRDRWAEQVRFGADAGEVARRSGGRVVYLATPYSKLVVDAEGRFCRVRHLDAVMRAAAVCAELARCGVTAVSPIVLAGTMCDAARCLDPLDEKFWNAWCLPLLAVSGSVYVPEIKGWSASRGVWTEACWALTRGVPVMVGAK